MTQLNGAFSDNELQQWIETCTQLSQQGYTAPQVLKKLSQSQGSLQPETGSGGLLSAARATLARPVTWEGVLLIVGGALGFLGLMKLVGMAFNVSIPFIHTAEPAEELSI